MMQVLRIPNGLQALGYDWNDVPALVAGTLPQQRVLQLAPGKLAAAETLSSLFKDSFKNY
jgi:hydroxyacid-oxoacid transhydrogenase